MMAGSRVGGRIFPWGRWRRRKMVLGMDDGQLCNDWWRGFDVSLSIDKFAATSPLPRHSLVYPSRL